MFHRAFISVIIPSYNSGRYVSHAVESALRQSYRPLEILVIDDGSTDNTREVLSPYSKVIRYINQPNRGPSAARNRGIVESRGALIAFLDADDLWTPEKLERQAEQFAANTHLGLSHTDLAEIDSNAKIIASHKQPGRLFSGCCYEQFYWNNLGPCSSVMVSREALDRVGIFDEQINKASAEDYDLWWRIARHYEVAYIDAPMLWYRIHAANGSKNYHVMDEAVLYVVLKALREDPSLVKRMGTEAIAQRLQPLYFDLGRSYAQRSETWRAFRYLFLSLCYQPYDRRVCSLFCSALLPRGVKHWIRWLGKKQLSGQLENHGMWTSSS